MVEEKKSMYQPLAAAVTAAATASARRFIHTTSCAVELRSAARGSAQAVFNNVNHLGQQMRVAPFASVLASSTTTATTMRSSTQATSTVATAARAASTLAASNGVFVLTGAPATPQLLRGLSAAAAAATVNVEVPSMGDSITEGAIAAVLKSAGESVDADEVICQIETDKVTIDVKAPAAGVVKEVLVAEEDTVVVGQCVATVEEGAAAAPKAAPKAAVKAASAPKAEAAAAAAPPPPPPSTPPPKAAPPTPTPAPPAAGLRSERLVPMKRMRKRVAERLKDAQNTYAMLSTFNEVDMTNITAMRSKYKDAFLEKHGAKLGFMSCFVKAASFALKEIPAVNGVIDGDNIIYRDYCDISIAVATPKGLVVPVLRNVETMGFADVEKSIANLGAKAREGSISIDDMAGGTFTISNGGVYGSLLSTPIINPPQSAILGMHSIINRPIAVNGVVEVRPMMYIALTYDHRLIDGREAVTFLRHIKAAVEDPTRLLLGV